MIDVVTNIDNLIISIIQKYNGDNIDISDNSLRDNLKKIYNSESTISTEPIYVSGLSNICCLSVFCWYLFAKFISLDDNMSLL